MSEPAPLPPLAKHCTWCAPFRMQCPECEERFPNNSWQGLVYTMHYAQAHLGIQVFRDLRAERR